MKVRNVKIVHSRSIELFLKNNVKYFVTLSYFVKRIKLVGQP